MISEQERSEVAENLRNLTIGRHIQYKEQFFDELAEVVVGFEDYHDFNVVLEKLADLIDRPTCRNEGCDPFICSECGECVSAERKIPGSLNVAEPYIPDYCPCCGAKVVDDDD